jgi:mono/diheme cytochrome c family protein
LVASSWVAGPESRLIKIVLDGVRGPMEVNGKTYDREMPGFGQVLSDADVAALLSFVRREFGGPSEPITLEAVRQIRSANRTRTDYWNTQELLDEK